MHNYHDLFNTVYGLRWTYFAFWNNMIWNLVVLGARAVKHRTLKWNERKRFVQLWFLLLFHWQTFSDFLFFLFLFSNCFRFGVDEQNNYNAGKRNPSRVKSRGGGKREREGDGKEKALNSRNEKRKIMFVNEIVWMIMTLYVRASNIENLYNIFKSFKQTNNVFPCVCGE